MALAQRIDAEGVDLTVRVDHNSMGPLSVSGWLGYLIQHPEWESKTRLRR